MSVELDFGDEVLGRGLAFPLRLKDGVLGMNSYESQVEQSIKLILRTVGGERVMRPNFGAGMNTLSFEPLNTVTASLIQNQVRNTLTQYEPRVDVLAVSVTPRPDVSQGARFEVALQYRVRRTNSVFNRVYPFYIEQGEL